jgi:hypothetical protein
MPLKAGRFEICGFTCAAETEATAIELTLVDDERIKSTDSFGKLLDSPTGYKVKLIHRKGIATYGVQIDSPVFSEPIKTRHGISVYAQNVKGGSLCVYVR